MRVFFTDPISSTVILDKSESDHLVKSARYKIGDMFTISDNNGTDYSARITSIDTQVTAEILDKCKNSAEYSTKIHLFLALPKSDKLDFVIQKATELGVHQIIPFNSRFCTAKLNQKDFAKKLPRFDKIAKEASKQSGRGYIPTIHPIVDFDEAISMMSSLEQSLIYYEKGGVTTSSIITQKCSSVGIMVGSEGGFCPTEIEKAIELDVKIATLGRTILRCETAPISGITLVLNALDYI